MRKLLLVLPASVLLFTACSPGEEADVSIENLKEKRDSLFTALNEINEEIAKKDTVKSNKKLVTTAQATKAPFATYFYAQGSVESDQNVYLNVELMTGGIIDKIYVREGQRVQKGALVAKINSGVVAQQIEQVNEGIKLAQWAFEQQTKLSEKNVGSELQLKQAETELNSLKKQKKVLQAQLSQTQIRAPFSGTIDEIFPNEGEMASPQMPIARLVNLKKITVVSEISEGYLPYVKKGSPVDVIFPAIKDTLSNLTLSKTGKFINAMNRTFKVQVDVNNQEGMILPNLLAKVKIQKEAKDTALLVPTKAILQDKHGKDYVYTLTSKSKSSKVQKVAIEKGLQDDQFTEILSPLSSGDLVVLDGAKGIINGEVVEVQQ